MKQNFFGEVKYEDNAVIVYAGGFVFFKDSELMARADRQMPLRIFSENINAGEFFISRPIGYDTLQVRAAPANFEKNRIAHSETMLSITLDTSILVGGAE